MTRFIKEPHLPQNLISACVISPEISSDIRQGLESLSIEMFFATRCRNIQPSVAAHSDMLCHHAGGRQIFLEQGQQELFGRLSTKGFEPIFIEKKLSAKYPHDIALNCPALSSLLFCNKKHTSSALLNYYIQLGYKIINVNQGYAKCSVLILNKNAVMSDDEGIVNAFKTKGIDALLVEKGDVFLEGQPYGFIGGCGGLIDKDKLALFGELDYHSDKKKIRAFANRHKVEIISLAKGRLVDYGGLLPVLERDI